MTLLALEDQMAGLMVVFPGMSPCELLAGVHLFGIEPNYPGFGDAVTARLPTETADGPVLSAIVNAGRWVVVCPSCQSANRASRQDRRFLCCECVNVDVGGRWLPVVWPDDVAGVEQALGRRVKRHDRAWLPGETVADLEKETSVLAESGLIKVRA